MVVRAPALQLARQEAHKPRHVLPIHVESNYTPDRLVLCYCGGVRSGYTSLLINLGALGSLSLITAVV